jgi:hypothetical protein
MQKKSMERRIDKLEEELTPEQIAKLGMSVLNKAWDKEVKPGEIKNDFEAWSDRYAENKAYGERVKIAFELHRLIIARLAFEYFKKCVSCNELAVMLTSSHVVQIRVIRVLEHIRENYVKGDIPKEEWEDYLKEHPEDRELIEGGNELSSLEKQGITEDMLIALQKEHYDNYREIISDSELWSLIGYPKPESEFLDNFLELEKALEQLKEIAHDIH